MESAYVIKTGRRYIPNLSEQFLISCDPGNDGCIGGNTKKSLDYIKDTKGLWYEGEYPYTEANTPCAKPYPTRDLGFPKLNSNRSWKRAQSNPQAIKQAVSEMPVSIAMQITGLELYKEGIIDESACPGEIYFDHTAVIVGYGYSGSTEFWILKNSWGVEWGEKGFMRVKITNDSMGVCGINFYPIYPNFE